jgi:hypothetical protein
MSRKTTWTSDGEVWVFEEGEYAKFTPRDGARQETADFRVVEVIAGSQVLTDLDRLSSYGWEGPPLTWAGEDFVLEE